VAKSNKVKGSKGRKATAKKASAARKTSAATASSRKASKARGAKTEATVTMDRRSDGDRRSLTDRRQKNVPVVVERRKLQRRAKVNRRRQIDPTTCERDYTADEIEFMNALDQYKRSSGRMFPTCSEILEVVRKLGYEKCAPAASDVPPDAQPTATQPAESPAGQEGI
jgi:hypothetical protein